MLISNQKPENNYASNTKVICNRSIRCPFHTLYTTVTSEIETAIATESYMLASRCPSYFRERRPSACLKNCGRKWELRHNQMLWFWGLWDVMVWEGIG